MRTAWSSGAVIGSVSRTFANGTLRLASQSVNDGATVTFGYDRDGLLTSAGAMTITRSSVSGNLTGTTLGSLDTVVTYDPVYGELASETGRHGSTTLLDRQYLYDRLGRVRQVTESVAGVTATYVYEYDTAGRLETVRRDGATTATYGYDANGNRTSANGVVATYDAQDRLSSYAGSTFTYLASGELRTRVDTTGTTTYTYDALGNLTNVALPDGRAIEYLVDGANRRIGRRVDGVLVQGFLYDGPLRVVGELDGSGNLVSRFVYGTRANAPDYVVQGTQTYRVLTDHLGSVRVVVNTATGAVVQRMRYDAYGVVEEDYVAAGFHRLPFGFAGGLYDRDTRLVRFGARDYDASIGRWTAKDPSRFAGGDANLFVYCAGNPVNLIDATGLLPANPFEAFRYIFCGVPAWMEARKVAGRGIELIGDVITNARRAADILSSPSAAQAGHGVWSPTEGGARTVSTVAGGRSGTFPHCTAEQGLRSFEQQHWHPGGAAAKQHAWFGINRFLGGIGAALFAMVDANSNGSFDSFDAAALVSPVPLFDFDVDMVLGRAHVPDA